MPNSIDIVTHLIANRLDPVGDQIPHGIGRSVGGEGQRSVVVTRVLTKGCAKASRGWNVLALG